MELQETLARLRKEHGLSQAELAEELGVTRQAISRWETGAASPTTDNLICLSQLFDVTMDELVKGRKEVDITPAEMPPAVRDAERTSPESSRKQKNIRMPIVILIMCLFSGTILWGKLTNSPIMAIDLLFWEVVFLILGSIAAFKWRNYRNRESRAEKAPEGKRQKKIWWKWIIIGFIVIGIFVVIEIWGAQTNSPLAAKLLQLLVAFGLLAVAAVYILYKVIAYYLQMRKKKSKNINSNISE